ncbi:YsnF/AvaK domain-containing protein [Saccharibacillus sp. CPCC 101409]|nr:YsnF/AvaK domain-containing protein [Saccharibacillus sp. CPCC 101409]MDO3410448.1 YsnF/AvaK domain-containing protein [Saccharibacillus sp. CPCC 101409]
MVDAEPAQEAEVSQLFIDHHALNSDRLKESDFAAPTTAAGLTTGVDPTLRTDPSIDPLDTRINTAGSQPVDTTTDFAAASYGADLTSRNTDIPPSTGAAADASRAGYIPEDTGITSGDRGIYSDEEAVTGSIPRDETDEARTLRLREEQLEIEKNKVQTGEVHIRKEIVEEQKTISVPVVHEEVVIERKAVHDEETNTPIGKDETIRIPLTEEQIEVNKRSVVTGEVEVHKREVQDTERVEETVRREEARVERTGDVEVDENLDADPTLRTTDRVNPDRDSKF